MTTTTTTKKTYVCPNLRELTVIRRAIQEECKPDGKTWLPRIAYAFTSNSQGIAEFTTEDDDVQKFMEKTEYYLKGKMILANSETKGADLEPKVKQGYRVTINENRTK